ncbi:hypothetical protein LBMAG13_18140 [Actinomycetes bacterium]|nr:hypothetical protein LBMAG13_18140 [Actinomycetes bacterium]
MNQVQKPSARLIVRLVIAVCLLGTMPTITAHPKSAKAATEYAVGSPGPAGGIVFYVATTPFKCGVDLTAECTYLEAAPNDWNSGIGSDPMLTWGCINASHSGAQGTSIGSGFTNTAAIMIACPDVSGSNSAPAARAADIYAPSGLAADWFLPSKDELNELCKYARETGQAAGGSTVCSGGTLRSGFTAGDYWSSSEHNSINSLSQSFQSNGAQYPESKILMNISVRPVRAFARVVSRPPTVTTNEATLVAASSATLNATVNANFGDATVAFSYATTADLSGATEAATGTSVTGSTDKTSTAALTGLKPGTKYYYRASATNSAGISPGEIKNFTTTGALPTVTTGSASSIKASSADLNAVVNANLLKTTVVFFYGLSADLTDGKSVSTRDITELTKVIDISAKIEGLVKSKTYYYRVEATNELGTTKGDIKSFVTSRAQGVTINDGAEFTNSKDVTISVVAPAGSVKVILSNDGGFGSSQTFDLVDATADIAWKLVASRDERLPKTVYVKWVSRFGNETTAVGDDIILDTTIPVLSNVSAEANTAPASAVTVAAVKKSTGAKIVVYAKDANSGVGKIEIKSSKKGKTTTVIYNKPTAASQTVLVKTTAKTLYVRVLDRAANASPWKTVTVK